MTNFTSCIKLSQNCINLHVKHKIIKLLADNVGENLEKLWFGKEFYDMTSKTLLRKEKNDKLDFTEIKNFCSMTNSTKIMKRQVKLWKKTFEHYISDKGFKTQQ